MKIGIIGGTGFDDFDDLEGKVQSTNELSVRKNEPVSVDFTTGFLGGKHVVFVPRHGRHHNVDPRHTDHLANMLLFYLQGVEYVIGVSAVGSLKPDIQPGHFVVPDQLYLHNCQATSFYGEDIVVHVNMRRPLCHSFLWNECMKDKGSFEKIVQTRIHQGGTYVNIPGPAFSTEVESAEHRKRVGAAVVGMNMIEAYAARELGLCYMMLAMVTDYDNLPGKQPVTDAQVREAAAKGVMNAQRMLKEFISILPQKPTCNCRDALKGAVHSVNEEDAHPLLVNVLRYRGAI
ncbi:MAG: MTAP family purine nucleoside phosphorylase [Nanoarchaeota archaeon]|nr:MTAP family purine nucleoside phosphorylase [Nanoarchaeota archaeon]